MSRWAVFVFSLLSFPVLVFGANCHNLEFSIVNNSHATFTQTDLSTTYGSGWNRFPPYLSPGMNTGYFYLEDGTYDPLGPYIPGIDPTLSSHVQGYVTYSAGDVPNKLTGDMISTTLKLYAEKEGAQDASFCADCQDTINVRSDVQEGAVFTSRDNHNGETYCAIRTSPGPSSKQAFTHVTIFQDPAVMSHLIIKYPRSTNHLADVRKIDNIVKNIRSQYSRYFDVSQSDMITIDADNDPGYISIEVRVVCDSQACVDVL